MNVHFVRLNFYHVRIKKIFLHARYRCNSQLVTAAAAFSMKFFLRLHLIFFFSPEMATLFEIVLHLFVEVTDFSTK